MTMADLAGKVGRRGQARRHEPSRLTRAELTIAWLMAAVQFYGMTDSMLMVPMGPLLVDTMQIAPSAMGYLTGAFVGAACCAGLLSSVFLDRYDRRAILLFGLVGLSAVTAATALATSFDQLVVTRLMTGLFAGPTMATTYAILADHIAQERRGRAMGIVAIAFGIASVMGVPAGLELALAFGWSATFIVIGAVGAIIAAAIGIRLGGQAVAPPHGPMTLAGALREIFDVACVPAVRVALVALALHVASNMLLVPNIANYMSIDLGYPVEDLGMLWMAGGAAGIVGGNIGGRLADRFGTVRVQFVNAALLSSVVALLWFAYRPGWPLMPVFAAFVMLNLSGSAVVNARISQVPGFGQRGRFSSLQVATQHASTTICSLLASIQLGRSASGAAMDMRWLAGAAILCALSVPFLMISLGQPVRSSLRGRLSGPATDPVLETAIDA